MIHVSVNNDFADWRVKARVLLRRYVKPNKILWTGAGQSSLFQEEYADRHIESFCSVPAEFLTLAEAVACFDDGERWALLYRLLFRLVYENRNLLHIESDPDVRQAKLMEKAVSRDVHKFHAFVRFKKVVIEGEEIFVAWHVPAHWTVERATPFFMRRFGAMRFSILTPKGCAHWDLKNLTFSAAVAQRDVVQTKDETEDFWLSYYRSIFNPFRLKIKAMKAEMPVRHWQTLPEAALIPDLIRRSKELENRTKFKKK